MSENINKKILYAWLDDYYLFSYGQDLVSRLVADGFSVTVLLRDYRVRDRLNLAGDNICVELLPSWLRGLSNMSANTFTRALFWVGARVYVFTLRRRFHFAIVPWDYRVLWYLISKAIPSLTIHNTTNFVDVNLLLDYVALRLETSKKFSHRILKTMDSWVGKRLLPRVNSRQLEYGKAWLIDKLMGCRSSNNLHGFSGIQYFTVMGDAIKENYQFMGVGVAGSPTKIFVVGSPNYERLRMLALTQQERQAIRRDLNVPGEAELFSLFLSPSSFDHSSVLEIRDVLETVCAHRENAWFVMKFHPKTARDEPGKIRAALGDYAARVTMVTAYEGDEWNARLVLASNCLLQKQGTVGFIAMMHSIPILSYNLRTTEYFDDMYEKIGGSFHAKSREELGENLRLLDTEQGREQLVHMQEVACAKYCRSDCSPCGEISRIIHNHFCLPVQRALHVAD
jgi:hypothetical protein